MAPGNNKKHSKKAKTHTTSSKATPVVTSSSPASLAAPAVHLTPATPASTQQETSPATILDFRDFVEKADLISVGRFCNTGASLSGEDLKLFWQRAYREGRNKGYNEGHEEGHEKGWEEGLAHSSDKHNDPFYDIGLEEGKEIGRQEEREAWLATNASRLFVDAVAQTEAPHSRVDATTQATPTSHSTSAVQSDLPATNTNPRFDWSEEPSFIPTIPIASAAPRDFSALRSSSPNPFASLQCRIKRFSPRQSRRSRYCISAFNLPQPSPQPARKSWQPIHRHAYTFFSQPAPASSGTPPLLQSVPLSKSQLDWEQDPRLSDLSRSLRALGWVRA